MSDQHLQNSAGVNAADLPLLVSVLLFDSLHFIFARLLVPYVGPATSAPLVMGIAAFQIGLYGWITGRLSLRALRHHWLFFLVIGLLIGSSTYLGYLAVNFIDAGTASMLNKISTVISVGLGLTWLNERFTPKQLAGTLVAVVGSLVIAYQPDAQLRWGALLILVGTFAYSLHFAVVKRFGSEMDFVNFLFFRMLFTSLPLLFISAGGQALEWPTAAAWLVIFITATFDVTVSRAFYYWALRRLDMSLLSVITTLGPVATVVWAFLFFDTLPTVQQLLGGIAVLIGVLLVTLRRK